KVKQGRNETAEGRFPGLGQLHRIRQSSKSVEESVPPVDFGNFPVSRDFNLQFNPYQSVVKPRNSINRVWIWVTALVFDDRLASKVVFDFRGNKLQHD